MDAESVWWGLWPATYVPSTWFWLATSSLAALLTAAAVAIACAPLSEVEFGWVKHMTPVVIALSAALFVAFFLFPIAHTRWGDAYMLANGIAWPDPDLRITHSWQAPLDLFLHSQVWLAFGSQAGWEDAVPVYRWLSPIAGGLYLCAALGIALGRYPGSFGRLAPPWLTWGLLVTLGLIALFFGYIENYSFAAAGVLVYLWLGLRTLAGRTPLWLASLTLALTNALHPSTVVLAPSLLYLAWFSWREGNRNKSAGPSVFNVLAQTLLPMLLVAASTFIWMELSGHGLQALTASDRPGGSDASWFVPLISVQTRWQHYTMFSWLHMRDVLNLLLLVAPVVLPSLVIAAIGGASTLRSGSATGELPFLGSATLCYLLFVWLWNPDYGGQRDWDLFSLSVLPMTLLAATLLAHTLRPRLLWAAMGPLILLQAMHTAAWIYSNTLPWEWPS